VPKKPLPFLLSSDYIGGYSGSQNYVPFGYGFSVIRRNKDIPFVNGGISASIISEQPQWTDSHEAAYSIRLYNFIIAYLGASSKPLAKSSANHIKFISKQDSLNRNINVITGIETAKAEGIRNILPIFPGHF
jgi:hypothetical protein